MRPPRSTLPEFIGGPEDGLVLDEALWQQLQLEQLPGGEDLIPMLLEGSDTGDFEEGDEVELVLKGFYVEEEDSDPPRFRWVPL
jgi:hypothetical protein